jgi:hypothetical protein
METHRLHFMREPARVERLLDAYVARTSRIPDDSYRVRAVSELPMSLRLVVARAVAEGRVWTCWARGSEVWLFTSEISLELSRARGVPVLLVNAYREDAELTDSGVWRYDPTGTWRRWA